MKSAYELAMERLNKSAPSVKLTEAQRAAIAEVDSVYQAKLAEREIFLKAELDKALSMGDFEAMEQVQRQLASEKKRIQTEMEEKKDRIRSGKD